MVEYQEVFLRPIDDHDTEKIVNWRNKTEVRQHFVYQKPFTKASHQQWMKTMVETKKVVQFIITVKETEKEIGSVFLRDVDLENQKAEFGIFIGETVARNKGYGTMAAKAIIDYGFNVLGLHKIFLRVFAENQRAIASYKKVGFIPEGYMKEDVLIDGTFRDMIFMAVFSNQLLEEKV